MAEERLVNLRHDTVRPPLPLTHAEASGGARGWLIESQRRMPIGGVLRMLVVRLTHPDQRRLTLVFGLGETEPNARTPVSRLLSPAVGSLFRQHRSSAAETAAVAAAERVFRVAWDAAERGWQGSALREVVEAAAHGLDMGTVHLWRTTLSDRQQRMQPTDRALVPVPVYAVARLIDSGLRVDQVLDWCPYRSLTLMRPHVLRAATQFAAAGWTREQASALVLASAPYPRLKRSVEPDEFPDPRWLRLPADQAVLAVRAGLSLEEALRLLEQGRLVPATLAMLAGLRQPPRTSLLGLTAA